jgi:CBS domain-containing protein
MQRQVVTVPPGMPLAELEAVLLDAGVGGAPVVEDGRVVGIISRSDIVKQANVAESVAGYALDDAGSRSLGADAAARGPATTPLQRERIVGGWLAQASVRDAMTDRVVAVAPGATLREVASLLASQKVHRVLVMRGTELLGVITAVDIVRLVADGRIA